MSMIFLYLVLLLELALSFEARLTLSWRRAFTAEYPYWLLTMKLALAVLGPPDFILAFSIWPRIAIYSLMPKETV
jgi:hypothetical protein